MLTTILISFAAFCLGFFLAGFMAGSKKVNKTPIERFQEAVEDVDVHKLTDEELDKYYAICQDEETSVVAEKYMR